jgi:hypothetical protein
MNVDAASAQALGHLVGKKGELVRPNARRDTQEQHAARDRNRLRLVGDTSADGFAPQTTRNGGSQASKPIFPRAQEDRFQALGSGGPAGAALAFHGSTRGLAMLTSLIVPLGAAGSKNAPRRSARPSRNIPSAQRAP